MLVLSAAATGGISGRFSRKKDMGVDGLSPQQWQISPEGKSCGDVVRPDFGCDKPVLLETTLNHSEKNSLD